MPDPTPVTDPQAAADVSSGWLGPVDPDRGISYRDGSDERMRGQRDRWHRKWARTDRRLEEALALADHNARAVNANADMIVAVRAERDAARAALARAEEALIDLTDVHALRERGLRVLGDEQCCEEACNGGACESCPCCNAGWCVFGADGQIPERDLTPGTDGSDECGVIIALSEAEWQYVRRYIATEYRAERDAARAERDAMAAQLRRYRSLDGERPRRQPASEDGQ